MTTAQRVRAGARRAFEAIFRFLAEALAIEILFRGGAKLNWNTLGRNFTTWVKKGWRWTLGIVAGYIVVSTVLRYAYISWLSNKVGTLVNPDNLHIGKAIVAGAFVLLCWLGLRTRPQRRFSAPALVILLPLFALNAVSELVAAKRYASFARVENPNRDDFFYLETHEPKLWYRRGNDGFEFFNMPTFELKPVTDRIRDQYFDDRRALDIRKDRERAEYERAQRLKELHSLFNPVPRQASRQRIAIAIGLEPSVNYPGAERKLVSALSRRCPGIFFDDGYLRPEFKAKGYFERAFEGETSFLQESGMLNEIDGLLLCKLAISDITPAPIEGVVSKNAALTYRRINDKGIPLTTGQVSATGPGLTQEEALNRALELLIEKHAADLISKLSEN